MREGLSISAPPPETDREVDSKTLPLLEVEGGGKVLPFYWLDMYEDHYKQPGTVYVFGKVKLEGTNAGYVRYSVCVCVCVDIL